MHIKSKILSITFLLCVVIADAQNYKKDIEINPQKYSDYYKEILKSNGYLNSTEVKLLVYNHEENFPTMLQNNELIVSMDIEGAAKTKLIWDGKLMQTDSSSVPLAVLFFVLPQDEFEEEPHPSTQKFSTLQINSSLKGLNKTVKLVIMGHNYYLYKEFEYFIE